LIFIVPPERILEHPDHLPTKLSEIEPGKLEGWWTYACSFEGHKIKESKDPEIIVNETGTHIRVGKTDYWFKEANDGTSWSLDRPCWYQSSSTLRFVKHDDPQPTELT
jgi:hypothetical protein